MTEPDKAEDDESQLAVSGDRSAGAGMSEYCRSGADDQEKARKSSKQFRLLQKSPIADVPVELLVHVFSFLSPGDLQKAYLVCRSWCNIIRNDLTWKNALLSRCSKTSRFQSVGSGSWRSEYLARTHMLRRIRRLRRGPRGSVISFDARVGASISCIWYNSSNRTLISFNGGNGLTAAHDGTSGKLLKMVEPPYWLHWAPITAIASGQHALVVSGGSGLIWVLYTTNLATISPVIMDREHTLPVTCLDVPDQDIPRKGHISLASGSLDQTVCLWDLRSGNCLKQYFVGKAVREVRYSSKYGLLWVVDQDWRLHVAVGDLLESNNRLHLVDIGHHHVSPAVSTFTEFPDKCLLVDFPTKTAILKLPIQESDTSSPFAKKVFLTEDGEMRAISLFGTGLIDKWAQDPDDSIAEGLSSNVPGENGRLFAAQASGSDKIHVFDIRTTPDANIETPLLTFRTGLVHSIDALSVSSIMVVCVASDSSAVAFDVLNGEQLRVLDNGRPERGRSNEIDRQPNCLHLDYQTRGTKGAMSFRGKFIKTWDFTNSEIQSNKRVPLSKRRLATAMANGSYMTRKDVQRREINDHLDEAVTEKEERAQWLRELHELGVGEDLKDLSEQELIDYAQMISREQNLSTEARPFGSDKGKQVITRQENQQDQDTQRAIKLSLESYEAEEFSPFVLDEDQAGPSQPSWSAHRHIQEYEEAIGDSEFNGNLVGSPAPSSLRASATPQDQWTGRGISSSLKSWESLPPSIAFRRSSSTAAEIARSHEKVQTVPGQTSSPFHQPTNVPKSPIQDTSFQDDLDFAIQLSLAEAESMKR